jgi:anti-sigma factor RsiW
MPRRPSYSCRQFRLQHVEYVDGLLPGDARNACDAHLMACPVCRRQDVQIRRSLMALQALPIIVPSPGFQARLRERIAHETLHYRRVHRGGARCGRDEERRVLRA